MANPTKYTPGYSYSGFQAANPTKPLPAPRVDDDFANISRAVNETIAALQDVRRSDGRLPNGIVGPDAISPALKIGFTFRGTWVQGTEYSLGDGVLYQGAFYSAAKKNQATEQNAPGDDTYWTLLFSVDDLVVNGALAMPVNRFTGDGQQADFALDFTPVAAKNLIITIGGVYQETTQYQVSGNTLLFNDPPPEGYSIEVRGFATLATSDTLVSDTIIEGSTHLFQTPAERAKLDALPSYDALMASLGQKQTSDASLTTLSGKSIGAKGLDLLAAATAAVALTAIGAASVVYVDQKVADLVNSAPALLDTLGELSSAIGNDPNFASTIGTSLGNRLRVDAAQSLTEIQRQQGRANLGVDQTTLDTRYNRLSQQIADTQTPNRLLPSAALSTDFNTALTAGWYCGSNAANAPTTSQWFLEVRTWNNGAHVMQTAASGFGTTNWVTYRRFRANDGTWSAWQVVRESQTELDARYAQISALATKFDKSGGTVTGSVTISAANNPLFQIAATDNSNPYLRLRATGSGFYDVALNAGALGFHNYNADGSYQGNPLVLRDDGYPLFNIRPYYGSVAAGNQFITYAEAQGLVGSGSGGVTGVSSFKGRTGAVEAQSGDYSLGQITGANDALNLKASLASPAFTGTPTTPTAALGTNTTQIATMAALQAAIGNLGSAASKNAGRGVGNVLQYEANGPYPILWLSDRTYMKRAVTGPYDEADLWIQRDAATGGTKGWVNSAFKVETFVNTVSDSYEWNIIGRVEVNQPGGEHVGIYSQAIKRANCTVWAHCVEMRDEFPNPTTGTLGMEVGVFILGTDNSRLRHGIDISVNAGNNAPGTNEIASAIRISCFRGQAQIKKGLIIKDDVETAIDMADLNTAYNQVGIKFGAGVKFSWEGTNFVQTVYDTGVLQHRFGGVSKLNLSNDAQDAMQAWIGGALRTVRRKLRTALVDADYVLVAN
jgi:hypothetical protein